MSNKNDIGDHKCSGDLLFADLGHRLIKRILENVDMSEIDSSDIELSLMRIIGERDRLREQNKNTLKIGETMDKNEGTNSCETNVELSSNEPVKLCPFQDRRKDGVIDVSCVQDKCMAGDYGHKGFYCKLMGKF